MSEHPHPEDPAGKVCVALQQHRALDKVVGRFWNVTLAEKCFDRVIYHNTSQIVVVRIPPTGSVNIVITPLLSLFKAGKIMNVIPTLPKPSGMVLLPNSPNVEPDGRS